MDSKQHHTTKYHRELWLIDDWRDSVVSPDWAGQKSANIGPDGLVAPTDGQVEEDGQAVEVDTAWRDGV